MKTIASLVIAAGIAAAPGGASALQITQVIDDFFAPMEVFADGAAPDFDVDFGPAGTAIGGARDFGAFKNAGGIGAGLGGQINPGGNNLLRVQIGDARGTVDVVWDGLGNGAIDLDGLGGLDLSAYDTVELVTTFSDLGGPIDFLLGNSSTTIFTTLTVPAGIPSSSSVIVSAALSAAVFGVSEVVFDSVITNVGYIAMQVDAGGLAQEGWDSRYDVIRLVGDTEAAVPLPAAAWMLLAGLGGLGALRMRRKAA